MGESALRMAFAAARARGELALLPYLTAGYPSLDAFVEHLGTVAAAGADVIEIGVPFSDPIADGPTIQHSSQVALRAGATLTRILDALATAPAGCPRVAMSYLNPLLALGGQRLLPALRRAGVVGLLIPDLPVEEADAWSAAAAGEGIDVILLAAPTSSPDRLARIGAASRGFVYAVSLAGTTGARAELAPGLSGFLARVRAASAGLPVAVGFGIARPEQVRALRGQVDGVVVGSRLVDALRHGEDLGSLVAGLKSATRS